MTLAEDPFKKSVLNAFSFKCIHTHMYYIHVYILK